MAARTKKTAAPAPVADIVTDGGFEPVRITTKKTSAGDGIPLFYLDDTPYTIPRTVPRSVILEYLRLSRVDGELAAAQRILERLLGPDAYQALEQSDEIDDDTLEKILTAVVHHISGPSESGK